MSGATVEADLATPGTPQPPKSSPVGRALTMMAPSVVTFLITVSLFAVLRDFDEAGLRRFTIAVMAAVILSLLGTAPLTPITIGIIGEGPPRRQAVNRAILVGSICCALWSLATSAALYRFMTASAGLSPADFTFMAALTLLQSLVWIVMGTYSATKQYESFASIFILGYVVLSATTYAAHRIGPEYTLAGYTAGVASLLAIGLFGTRQAFPDRGDTSLPALRPALRAVARGAVAASPFHFLYVVAIFLDKIIVWTWVGHQDHQGLTIYASYTMGSFLGLVPIFALAVTAHFEARATPLVMGLYRGRLSDIQRTAGEYKRLYRRDGRVMSLLGLALLGLAAAVVTLLFRENTEMLRVLLTIGAGCILFSRIIFDYMVLSFFGRTPVSAAAVLLVCVAVMVTIGFVRLNLLYVSFGFLAGSLAGCITSQYLTYRRLRSFEFNVFRSAVRMAKEESLRVPDRD